MVGEGGGTNGGYKWGADFWGWFFIIFLFIFLKEIKML
jgi:hypothetical protein